MAKMRGIRRRISKLLPQLMGNRYEYLDSDQPSPKIFPRHMWLQNDHSQTDGQNVLTPKGYFCVCVGNEKKRFFVPTLYLKHPLMRLLLEKSAEEFGMDQVGVLTIPCDVQSFQHVLWSVHTDPTATAETAKELAKHYYMISGSYPVEDAKPS
eukprot:Gb_29888 [translate_table: standard]